MLLTCVTKNTPLYESFTVYSNYVYHLCNQVIVPVSFPVAMWRKITKLFIRLLSILPVSFFIRNPHKTQIYGHIRATSMVARNWTKTRINFTTQNIGVTCSIFCLNRDDLMPFYLHVQRKMIVRPQWNTLFKSRDFVCYLKILEELGKLANLKGQMTTKFDIDM